MQIRNTEGRYGLFSKLLHWLIAIFIIGLIWLGWYMVDLDYFNRWFNTSREWHRSLGMLTLVLALIKIGWQFYSPVPGPAAHLKHWESNGANIMHKLLLIAMIAIPVTGYLISTSGGETFSFLDWFDIPALFHLNSSIRDWTIDLHFYLSYGTGLLLIGHIGAALKHAFIDKDDTLKRILWD
ncbi:MAG: cytochrome b [Gammaproteobacteria bacterium]